MPLETPETKMEEYQYDAILHYLKSAVNVNSSTDIDQTTKSSPTWQVNSPNISSTRPIHSIRSGNLANSTMPFKNYKNIQQSHKRSHTNPHTDNMDEIPGTSSEIIENNLTIQLKSNELIDVFNTKTMEITEAMKGLHFSTIGLRNKLSRGCITNKHPIIAQVTMGNNVTTQVRVEIYPPAQYCWCEIRGYSHKKMHLHIKASYYEALSKNNIYPPWTIVLQPPPNLMLNQHQVETILTLRRTQAKEMLTTLSTMSTNKANRCKNRGDASTQALKAYYQLCGASEFNFNEALDAFVTLTDWSPNTLHEKQQKKFIELSNRPILALYMGIPDQLILVEIKNQNLQPFMPTPLGEESNEAQPGGWKITYQNKKTRGPSLKKGNPKTQKIKKILV